MKKLLLMLLNFFVVSSGFAAIAPLDGQETHGGNVVLMEFWQQHNTISDIFAACPESDREPLAVLWKTEAHKIDVRSSEKVFIGPDNSQEVVAMNNPQADPPLILISESQWPALSETEKTKITIHEVLPILGVVDSNYEYSERLYNKYYDCMAPFKSRRELLLDVAFCTATEIERWRAPEMKVLRASALGVAAYNQCMPALQKLMQFGYDLKSCGNDYYAREDESPLMNALKGYYGSERSSTTLDFFLSLDNTAIAADCDPDFKKTCAFLDDVSVRRPSEDYLKAFRRKLKCSR